MARSWLLDRFPVTDAARRASCALSLHDALPILKACTWVEVSEPICADDSLPTSVEVSVPTWVSVRATIDVVVSPSTEEHTSEVQSHSASVWPLPLAKYEVVRPWPWVDVSAPTWV